MSCTHSLLFLAAMLLSCTGAKSSCSSCGDEQASIQLTGALKRVFGNALAFSTGTTAARTEPCTSAGPTDGTIEVAATFVDTAGPGVGDIDGTFTLTNCTFESQTLDGSFTLTGAVGEDGYPFDHASLVFDAASLSVDPGTGPETCAIHLTTFDEPGYQTVHGTWCGRSVNWSVEDE